MNPATIGLVQLLNSFFKSTKNLNASNISGSFLIHFLFALNSRPSKLNPVLKESAKAAIKSLASGALLFLKTWKFLLYHRFHRYQILI